MPLISITGDDGSDRGGSRGVVAETMGAAEAAVVVAAVVVAAVVVAKAVVAEAAADAAV